MSQYPGYPPPLPSGYVLPARRPRRWVRVLLSLVIFFGGVAVGSAGTIIVAVHRIQYVLHHPDEAPRRITAMLNRRLHLSPEQQIQIENLIAVRQHHLQDIRRESQPRVEAELQGLRHDIDGVLDSDQRDEWDAMFDGVISRWLPPPPPPAATEQ
jgi:hypothetical protein